jgi:iron complex transport system ATP-binding protein
VTLKASSASAVYGETRALNDVSLELREGEFAGLVGPNGSGKTTLIRVLSGVTGPSSGEVTLDGKRVRQIPARELARSVAVIPQQVDSAFRFSVLETVLMGRYAHLGRLRLETERDYEVARRCLQQTGMLDLAGRDIVQLSGGERQRAFIARALAQETRLLLLDEPTAHLDLRHQVELMNLIAELNRQEGLGILVALHDVNLAARYCRRLLLLHEGTAVAQGAPRDVITERNLQLAYGTRVRIAEDGESGAPQVTILSEKQQGCEGQAAEL